MSDYEELEEKAREENRKKKPKMKVSGRSVFLLKKQAEKTEEDSGENKASK